MRNDISWVMIMILIYIYNARRVFIYIEKREPTQNPKRRIFFLYLLIYLTNKMFMNFLVKFRNLSTADTQNYTRFTYLYTIFRHFIA